VDQVLVLLVLGVQLFDEPLVPTEDLRGGCGVVGCLLGHSGIALFRKMCVLDGYYQPRRGVRAEPQEPRVSGHLCGPAGSLGRTGSSLGKQPVSGAVTEHVPRVCSHDGAARAATSPHRSLAPPVSRPTALSPHRSLAPPVGGARGGLRPARSTSDRLVYLRRADVTRRRDA